MGDLTRLQPFNGSNSSSSTYYGQPNTPSTGSTFHASPSSSADSSPTSASGPEVFIVSTIIPGFLYLGPDPTTEDEVAQLNSVGIKRILNMAVECEDELRLSERFEVYRKVGIRDSVEEMGVAKGLKEACSFLGESSRSLCGFDAFLFDSDFSPPSFFPFQTTLGSTPLQPTSTAEQESLVPSPSSSPTSSTPIAGRSRKPTPTSSNVVRGSHPTSGSWRNSSMSRPSWVELLRQAREARIREQAGFERVFLRIGR